MCPVGLRTPPAGRSRPWTAVDSEVTRVGRPVAEAREGRAATGWAAHPRPGPGRRGLMRLSSGLTPARPARCCAGARAAPARRNLQRIPHWGRVLIVWPHVPHISPGTRPDAGAPSAPTPPSRRRRHELQPPPLARGPIVQHGEARLSPSTAGIPSCSHAAHDTGGRLGTKPHPVRKPGPCCPRVQLLSAAARHPGGHCLPGTGRSLLPCPSEGDGCCSLWAPRSLHGCNC